MTATAHPSPAGTAASARLPSLAGKVVEFVWPMYLTLVLTLGAWVVVPGLVLGWTPVTVISGSMAPAIQPGQVVLFEPFRGQDVGPGTVVTFRDHAQDRLVTHRIVAVHDDGTIATRGDANADADPVPLTRDRIVGVGRLVVPAAGLPALWAHEGRTDLLAIVVALSVLTAGSAASAAVAGARAAGQQLSLRRGTRRRSPVRTVGLATGVVVVLVVLGTGAVSAAAFVGVGQNPANAFAARTVPAPEGLTGSGSCGEAEQSGRGSKPSVPLAWDPVPGATAYEVQRATAEGGPYTWLATVTGSCHRDADVNASTTYHYQVRTSVGAWTSAWSEPTSARPQRGPG